MTRVNGVSHTSRASSATRTNALNGASRQKPIGILYEHPEWFKLLFAELERRGIPYEKLYVDEHWFDPTARFVEYLEHRADIKQLAFA